VRIFISHQKDDTEVASEAAKMLIDTHGLDVYLDVFDPDVAEQGVVLGDHVHKCIVKCTHLLAIVSESTQGSWWVPWEIGIATERGIPIAVFSQYRIELPAYLLKWPNFDSREGLERFANVAKNAWAAANNDIKKFGKEDERRREIRKAFYEATDKSNSSWRNPDEVRILSDRMRDWYR
jgi:hypothetical protein